MHSTALANPRKITMRRGYFRRVLWRDNYSKIPGRLVGSLRLDLLVCICNRPKTHFIDGRFVDVPDDDYIELLIRLIDTARKCDPKQTRQLLRDEALRYVPSSEMLEKRKEAAADAR
jgi:hypothetical protein